MSVFVKKSHLCQLLGRWINYDGKINGKWDEEYDEFYTLNDNRTVRCMHGATTQAVTRMLLRYFGIDTTGYKYKLMLKPMDLYIAYEYSIL